MVAFENGLWFTGESFAERTFYTAEGLLYDSPPAPVDFTVDLSAKYVIPPYADAHAHLLPAPDELPPILDSLRARGIFYVRNLNNAGSYREAARGLVNVPGSIDFAFANGGLTSILGHPMYLAETLALELYTPEAQREALQVLKTSRIGAGNSYFAVEDVEDVDSLWEAVLAGDPDVVKIYLLNSALHEQTAGDDEYIGRRGLDPTLVPIIVERAHDSGLPVSAHVETSYDFGVAVRAGVDQLAHLPGYGASTLRTSSASRYEIAVADAELAGKNELVVVPTVSLARAASDDEARFEAIQELQRANLRLLIRNHVTLVVGSDANTFSFRRRGVDARTEVRYLRNLSVLTDAELLRAWVEFTPQSIFPGRRIGRLADGYEASFLVLSGNPLEDWDNTEAIDLSVKNGLTVDLP
ncbi:MAG: hypothetical protein ABFS14_10985 [Gemmatimonadota bacterium]